jgi:hypothetical protein
MLHENWFFSFIGFLAGFVESQDSIESCKPRTVCIRVIFTIFPSFPVQRDSSHRCCKEIISRDCSQIKTIKISSLKCFFKLGITYICIIYNLSTVSYVSTSFEKCVLHYINTYLYTPTTALGALFVVFHVYCIKTYTHICASYK